MKSQKRNVKKKVSFIKLRFLGVFLVSIIMLTFETSYLMAASILDENGDKSTISVSNGNTIINGVKTQIKNSNGTGELIIISKKDNESILRFGTEDVLVWKLDHKPSSNFLYFQYSKDVYENGGTWKSPLILKPEQVVIGGIVFATGYSCSSDIRFKENIKTLQNSLQKIASLNGVSYNWKKETFKDKGFTSDRQIGLIAQDVEKVLPELVTTDDEGYKSIHYDKLSAVLVEAVKEMSAKTTALEKENASLKQRLASLEKMNERVARLESLMKQQKAVVASR